MDAMAAADGLNFELPEEIRMLKDTVRKFVDRELIPIERSARDGHKLKPEVRAHLIAKASELGLAGYDVPQRIRRARHGAGRQGDGVGGARPHHRAAVARRRRVRPERQPDPLPPQRSAEAEVPAADDPRRAELVPRADRARRRRRSRRHAHDRGAPRRPLRHQRRQALHHRRRRRALHAADRGDRPRQGLARRHLRLHRRHEGAGRAAVALAGAGGRRPALGDRVRGRQGAGRRPHRRGRRRLPPRAALAQRRPHSPRRARHRRDRALPGARRAATPSSASPSASRWPSGRRCNGCWPTASWSCTSSG